MASGNERDLQLPSCCGCWWPSQQPKLSSKIVVVSLNLHFNDDLAATTDLLVSASQKMPSHPSNSTDRPAKKKSMSADVSASPRPPMPSETPPEAGQAQGESKASASQHAGTDRDKEKERQPKVTG